MRGIDPAEEEADRTRGALASSAKESLTVNAGKLVESVKSLAKRIGIVKTLPDKTMNLKDGLLLWLTDLYKRSEDEEEKKLLVFLILKIHRVFQLNNIIVTYWSQHNPQPNPLMEQFDASIAALEAEEHSEVNTSIIKSVKELAPDLEWYIKRTKCLEPHGETTEYVNANIIGERGVIRDDKLTVGLTVMPPNIQYPEHQHVAEEFYLVLSDGEWNKHSGEWEKKTLGDYVYNESNIVHSTRSRNKPLVTLWFHYHPTELQNFVHRFVDFPKVILRMLGHPIEDEE